MEFFLLKNRFSIRLTILSTFMLVAGAATLVSIAVQFYFSRDLAREGAIKQFEQVADKVSERASHLQNTGTTITELLAQSSEVHYKVTQSDNHPVVPVMANTLTLNPSLYALYLANTDDSYLQLINLELSDSTRNVWQASPADRWLELRFVASDNKTLMIKRYLDDNLNVRLSSAEESDYHPSTRPWYKQANQQTVSKSAPYVMRFTGDVGVSFSKKAGENTVVGTGVLLSVMMDEIQSGLYSDDMISFLYNRQGFITAKKNATKKREFVSLASLQLTEKERLHILNNPKIVVSSEIDAPPFDFSVGGKPSGYFPDLLEIVAAQLGIQVVFSNGSSFAELYDDFRDDEIDVLQAVLIDEERSSLGRFTDVVLDGHMVAVTHKNDENNYRSIDQMKNLTVAVSESFVVTHYLEQNYPDIKKIYVNNAHEAMQKVISGEADVSIVMQTIARYFKKYFFIKDIKLSAPLSEFEDAEEFDLHFLVNNRHRPLASAINKALKAIPESEMQRLYAKWLSEEQFNDNQAGVLDIQSGKIPFDSLIEIAENRVRHDDYIIMANEKSYYGFSIPVHANIFTGDSFREYLGVFIPVDEAVKPYYDKVYIAMLFSGATFLVLLPLIFYLVKLIDRPLMSILKTSTAIAQDTTEEVNMVDSKIKEIALLGSSFEQVIQHLKNKRVDAIKDVKEATDYALKYAANSDPKQLLGYNLALPMCARLLDLCQTRQLTFLADKSLDKGASRNILLCITLSQFMRFSVPSKLSEKTQKLSEQHVDLVRMRIEVLWHEAESQFWQEVNRNPDDKEILRDKLKKRVSVIKHYYLALLRSISSFDTLASEDRDLLIEMQRQQWVRKLNPDINLVDVQNMNFDAAHLYSPVISTVIDDWEKEQLLLGDVFNEQDKAQIDELLTQSISDLYTQDFIKQDSDMTDLLETIQQVQQQGIIKPESLEQGIIIFCIGFLRKQVVNNQSAKPLMFEALLESFKQDCMPHPILSELYDLMLDAEMEFDFQVA